MNQAEGTFALEPKFYQGIIEEFSRFQSFHITDGDVDSPWNTLRKAQNTVQPKP